MPKNRFLQRQLSKPSSARKEVDDGFSLLELVAVLTVLSALTVISTVGFTGKGGILGQIKFANIDEAKALLNSAAADCLQKNRMNNANRDLIDEEIMSDKRIDSIGFKINTADKADKCSYFQLVPKSKDDDILYPIGFSVVDGSLSKFATPTSTDERSISSCERWAGVNCRQDESLKKLVEWKNSIAIAKKACEANYSKWLTEKNTQPLQFARWNSNADAGCPAKPPADGSSSYQTDSSCTTNGCNRTVYGLDGKFVGFTREDYDRALEAKYGKACTEWVTSKKLANYTNDPQNQPAELKECGSQKFWFYKGIDVGNKEEFDKRICSDNLEKEKTTPGKRTVKGCGDQIYYFSENKIHESEREYKESSCKVEKYNQAQEGKDGAHTTTEVGAEGCGKFWICKKEILDSEEAYKEKCKAPEKKKCIPDYAECDDPQYYGHHLCRAYSQCMGRI